VFSRELYEMPTPCVVARVILLLLCAALALAKASSFSPFDPSTTFEFQFIHEILPLNGKGGVNVVRRYDPTKVDVLFKDVKYTQATPFTTLELSDSDQNVTFALVNQTTTSTIASFTVTVCRRACSVGPSTGHTCGWHSTQPTLPLHQPAAGEQYTLVAFAVNGSFVDSIFLENAHPVGSTPRSLPCANQASRVCQVGTSFGMDRAMVRFINVATTVSNLTILGVSSNCYRCLHLPIATLSDTNRMTSYLSFDTTFPTQFEVLELSSTQEEALFFPPFPADDGRRRVDGVALDDLIALHQETHDDYGRLLAGSGSALLEFEYHFGEHGVYTVVFREGVAPDEGSLAAQIQVTENPDQVYAPLYIAIGVICALAILWFGGSYLYRVGLATWEKHKQKTAETLGDAIGNDEVSRA